MKTVQEDLKFVFLLSLLSLATFMSESTGAVIQPWLTGRFKAFSL